MRGIAPSVWHERFRKSYEAVGTTARTAADTFDIFLVRVAFVNVV
jgi:hypothetical protein